MLMDEYFIEFERILGQKFEKCMCTRCGEIQSHTIVYCYKCGDKFTFKPKTIFEAMLTAKNRQNQKNCVILDDPSYIASINAYYLKKKFGKDISKEFAEYIQKKYDE